MNLETLIASSAMVSRPPPVSVNVRVGDTVNGPGGKWIPCATKIAGGVYCSGLFQVGPGRRQVCATDRQLKCADEALALAVELASSAAA